MVHGFFALFVLKAIVIKASCTYCLAMEAIMPALRVLGFLLPAPRTPGRRRNDRVGAGPTRRRALPPLAH